MWFFLAKDGWNFEKHGIDFDQAQALWRDNALEFPARNEGESRQLRIAARDGKVRIISVRRARENERSEYYER